MENIPLIALTGGPCGGKTTALPYLLENLRDIGITAVIANEQATNYFTSGVSIQDLLSVENGIGRFQALLASAILNEENVKRSVAAILPGEQKVILCDRGVIDIAAYMEEREFNLLLHELGMSREELLARYDAAFHLVTAASGAEEHYNLDNEARTETAEEARETDIRTRNAWVGHEHFHIISNAGNDNEAITFEQKLHRLYRAVCLALGVPAPLEIEKKFLVQREILDTLIRNDVYLRAVDIRQIYLSETTAGVERRLRARMQPGTHLADRGTTYTYTEKKPVRAGVRTENSRIIDLREYLSYEDTERDTARAEIEKTRYNFVIGNTYFHLDMFSSVPNLALLEVEFTDETDTLELPDILLGDIVGEVTNNPQFYNANIALSAPIIST